MSNIERVTLKRDSVLYRLSTFYGHWAPPRSTCGILPQLVWSMFIMAICIFFASSALVISPGIVLIAFFAEGIPLWGPHVYNFVGAGVYGIGIFVWWIALLATIVIGVLIGSMYLVYRGEKLLQKSKKDGPVAASLDYFKKLCRPVDFK